MEATITVDHLDGEDKGRVFTYSDVYPFSIPSRTFECYDDDGEHYYTIRAELADDCDLGTLLDILGAYAGVTELRDVTGDGEDWSAS